MTTESSPAAQDALFGGPGDMRMRSRSLDWSATPLGPVAKWPSELCAAVRLMLASPVAMSLWCGPEYTLLYNDAYSRILAAKHPGALGRSGAAVWNELWPALEMQFQQVRQGGPAIYADETRLTMERLAGGAAEDAWFTYALSPLVDGAGACLAVYNVAVEVTEKIRARTAAESAQQELQSANAQLQEQGLALAERTEQAEMERERAAGILENMADAHFVLDSDFRFISVNAASERALQHSKENLLGRTIWEMFPFALNSIFEESYRRVAAECVEVHFVGTYEDGTLDLVPEVDAYPAPGGGVAVFWRDVGPRVRAEAALRASEQRLRDVFEQAPIAVAVMTGPDHVYTAASPMYARTPGLGRQLLGRSMRDAFPEVSGQGYIETLDEVYRTGVPYSATERLVRLVRPDGVTEERFFNIGYQPLRDTAGKVYAVASVAYDVTEQVRARHEVERARSEAEWLRAEAEAANRAKSEFLSTMSHELRTPLNAIGGYADLLSMELRGPVTERQRQDLERIKRANQHLMGLVTDVLNFARLDAGQVEFHVVDADLAKVVDDIEPLVAPQLAAKQLSFEHDGCLAERPDVPHMMRADPEKVRQILLNLLTNAVKFTDAGGRVSIACETDAVAGVVLVHVTDTGRGIAADQLERIFEPFVQVDRHRTHDSQQGVGLGLAISRDLARAMGGDLKAASTPDEGSTFTLQLPAGV